MKVLLLGGTSFFGRDIASLFQKEGFEVTLFSRGKTNSSFLKGFNHFLGDRQEITSLKKAAIEINPDIVIDNIGYTAKDLEIALTAFSSVKHFIFTSTVSVYRYRSEYLQPITEEMVDFNIIPKTEDLSNVHWSYARGKWESEKTILQKCQTPWTIIRPPVVYGPYDVTERGFWYLARLLDEKGVISSDCGVQSFRIAYSKDIARAFLLCAKNKISYQKTYNVAQSEVITLNDFLKDSAEFLGVLFNPVAIPSQFCEAYQGPYASMVNFIPDDTKIRKELNFTSTPWKIFGKISSDWFFEHKEGMLAKLLKGRESEIAIIERWKKITQGL